MQHLSIEQLRLEILAKAPMNLTERLLASCVNRMDRFNFGLERLPEKGDASLFRKRAPASIFQLLMNLFAPLTRRAF